MSNLINKIFGREEEKETHSAVTVRTSTSSDKDVHQESCTGKDKDACAKTCGNKQVCDGRTVQRDGVNIKSTISSDAVSTVSMVNQQKLNDLAAKLGSTHKQIDEYAKKQADKINDEIQREIDAVIARTRHDQEILLQKANAHTAKIDDEYRARLQLMVEEIDAAKAKQISEIEKELNDQQADILRTARSEIDHLNQKAANLKIGAIQQAQVKAAADATVITDQAANLVKAGTTHRETGTTTIKTEVTAAAATSEVSASTVSAVASGAKISTDKKK